MAPHVATSLLALLITWPAATGQTPPAGLAALATPRARRALQFSSADRNGGNEDTGNWLRVEDDGTRVLAEVDGPGRITRIWSANPSAEIQLQLDGETVFSGPMARLFDQTMPPFVKPLSGCWGGGSVCQVPVPFRRRLRLTSPQGPGFYYQIGVELGPEPERFAMPPGPHVQREIESLLAGANGRDTGVTIERRELAIVGRRRLLHRAGPGELIELRLRHGAGADAALWLEVRYDDEPEPALTAPLDELFAALPLQIGDHETLRLPMPFRRSIDLQLVDRTPRPADTAFATALATAPRVDLEATFRTLSGDHDADREGLYLHARRSHGITVWGEPFGVLETVGRGHFVGLVALLAAGSGQGLTFLEGDELVTVDGAVAFRGTGTEDLFSGAWYFRGGAFKAPFHALSELDGERQRVVTSRFFVADPIPFTRALRFDLEHGGTNDAPGSDYRTLAFWYSDSPAGQPAAFDDEPPRPSRTIELRHAADLWPEHTAAQADLDLPLRTVLPSGSYPMPRQSVVTLFSRGRTVHGPMWLTDDAAVLELPAALEVDAVRIEPILPAIRAWRIAGPFPGGNRRGIDRVFGPERDADPEQQYDDIVGDGPHGWRDLPSRPWPVGYVDLNPLFAPNDEVVAYAATEVHSPREQTGVLWLGSDDAVQVFLNGERIHEHRGLRGAARDQDRIEIRLWQGTNRLLVKVEDYFGGFGLFARIEGADGLHFTARGPWQSRSK